MTADVRRRLIAFLLLSAVGIVYVSASYLGFVDKLLGRGYTLHADLPGSGGLYVGSAVTYRGLEIGEVTKVRPTDRGISVDLRITSSDVRIPEAAPFEVHNLTAVGEQYLDFEPTSDSGPFAPPGTTFHGGARVLPEDAGDLLVQLHRFVSGVDRKSLQTTIRELGTTFRGTGRPLQGMVDDGSRFLDTAMAHEDSTKALLRTGLTVLKTQQAQGDSIRTLARQLDLLTRTLARSDKNVRVVLQASPPALHQVDLLIRDLGPTMPTLLGNLVTDESVVDTYLPGVEQLLVVFPRVVASGFTGTGADGWGRINMQTDNSVDPCTQGYLPPSKWRRTDITTSTEPAHVRCAAGPPFNMRGANYAPAGKPLPAPKTWRGSYSSSSGRVYGPQGASSGRLADQGDLSMFGKDSWKWLVISPVMQP